MANGKVECLKKKKSRVLSLTPVDLSQNLTLQCQWCVTEWKKVQFSGSRSLTALPEFVSCQEPLSVCVYGILTSTCFRSMPAVFKRSYLEPGYVVSRKTIRLIACFSGKCHGYGAGADQLYSHHTGKTLTHSPPSWHHKQLCGLPSWKDDAPPLH